MPDQICRYAASHKMYSCVDIYIPLCTMCDVIMCLCVCCIELSYVTLCIIYDPENCEI
jgi:hypothetical protein